MHASTFNRERQRIERRSRGKVAKVRRALHQLVQRAGAATIIEGNRIVGYRMRDGSVACLKIRYRTDVDAQLDMLRIQALPTVGHKPIRAYRCPWCHGYHLTSRRA